MIEVLKQALEALETPKPLDDYPPILNAYAKTINNAITSLRQAIREHAMYEVQRLGQEIEQEPVAWLEPEWKETICPEVGYVVTMTDDHPRDLCWIPLYAHSPQRTWVGLTDEEKKNIFFKWYGKQWGYTSSIKSVMASVEAKLKEKNT